MPPSTVKTVSKSALVIPGLIASIVSITSTIVFVRGELIAADLSSSVDVTTGTGCPCCPRSALAHAGTRAKQNDRRGIISYLLQANLNARPDTYRTEYRRRTALSRSHRAALSAAASRRAT